MRSSVQAIKSGLESCGNQSSSQPRKFDYGKVSDEYQKYRKAFPEKFFTCLQEKGLIKPGQNVLDLGAGTGMIARRIAQIKPECQIIALDCSQEMLDTAAKEDKEMGITNIAYHCSPAEKTGLPDNHFDLIIAARSWHWFNQEETIQELIRISKPGATVVITHYDPALEENNPLDITTQLINQYDPTWKLPIKGKLEREYDYINQLMNKNFGDLVLEVFIEQKLVGQDEWVKFFNTTSGVGGNSKLSVEQIESLNNDHTEILKKRFGDGNDLKIKYILSTIFSKVPDKKLPTEEEQLSSSKSHKVSLGSSKV